MRGPGVIRPLDRVRSIKLKISILLLVSGGVGLAYLWLEFRWQPPVPTTLVTIALVLLTAQVLGNGMTRPVREMIDAARAMASGDYTRRVRATSRDEVGELAAAFNRMAADLADADQRRRELIANVSHELRTPIAALQAVLENVVDGVAEPDPATLGTALAQTQRLGRLVTELLDLSRIDAGTYVLDAHDTDLEPLLAQAVAEAEVAARVAGRGIRFGVDVVPGTSLHADPERLHQVVVNLLDNAARHGPPGSEVHVSGRREGSDIVIEVRDEGPGIAPEDRERVFGRFTRGERAVGGGTGLGLAIARWVVDLHGGRIQVAPTTPGCRIRVTLPVAGVRSAA
ncbi:HAMP domain-containing protein [Pseudonocardia sp. KRD-184]|uniref:histidine kinase n=1 Tax=Pseudonocardia oceani TaxID=2792013 RepID=A0ABS6U518_9PSEU|nr:HAMP domain-containing protein [Pseudonocardia oceani]MBW0123246.1 HAMP domain-containing protein [Pseudonocardia oceani]MBW0127325.1 HAMP domain-containing protein [Pseudonocardia oceani]